MTSREPFDEPDDNELLTAWEASFMASITEWEGELTPAQEDKRAEIEGLTEARRAAWRAGHRGPWR